MLLKSLGRTTQTSTVSTFLAAHAVPGAARTGAGLCRGNALTLLLSQVLFFMA